MHKRDYAESDLDIQYAMLDHYKRCPTKKGRPESIIWGGIEIATFDVLDVPRKGMVRASILSCKSDLNQGFDMEVDGWFTLAKNEKIKHLRTWKDERYEDVVEYPYFSRNGELRFWNVYRVTWLGGMVTEENFTGNAGFWMEKLNPLSRIYHCSPGMIIEGDVKPPDFESLIVKLEVEEAGLS